MLPPLKIAKLSKVEKVAIVMDEVGSAARRGPNPSSAADEMAGAFFKLIDELVKVLKKMDELAKA